MDAFATFLWILSIFLFFFFFEEEEDWFCKMD